MARMTSKLVVMGLAGLLAVPGAYAGGTAVNTNSPRGTLIGPVTNPLENVTDALQNMGNLNVGALTGQNFGQMLMTSVMTQLTSQLLGKIDPTGMLSGVAGNFGGMASTGLNSQLFGGGIQNAISSGSLNFGGLVDSIVKGAVDGVVKIALDKVLGGIQGGGDSGSDGGDSSGGGTSIGGVVDEDAPILAFTTNIDNTSTNFVAGQYDAAQGLQPDSRFLMVNGEYDSNYWAGYSRALANGGVSI